MRTAAVLLLGLLASITAHPQTNDTQAAPDVQVLKYSWDKERINWEGNPFNSSERGNDPRSAVNRDNRERRGGSALIMRDYQEERKDKSRPPDPPRYVFNYKISIHNTGTKAIKEIDWDYVFRDAATGEELGRREFTSVEKIEPGKRKELSVSVSSPPTKKISAYSLGKRERDGLTEQVVIVRILFNDDSVWQAR